MAFKSIRKHFTKNEELSSIKGTYERFSIISENPNFVEIQVNGQKFWFSHQKILDFQNIKIITDTLTYDANRKHRKCRPKAQGTS